MRLIILALSVLVLGYSTLSVTTNIQNINEYNYMIKINIEASKEEVWSVITDFENYDKWNSVLKMQGNNNLELGKTFDVIIFEKDGSKADSFQAIAINKTKYQSFSASQTILTKYFFRATHHFIIKELSKNEVVFIQGWELEGVIGYLFEGMIIDVLELFKNMNLELKAEVEKRYHDK